MFHYGLIEAYTGETKKKERQKVIIFIKVKFDEFIFKQFKKKQTTPFEIRLSSTLKDKLVEVCTNFNLTPKFCVGFF